MSLLSGFQNMSVERVTGPTAVRRIERDKDANDNRKQQDSHKRHPAHEDTNEEQEDVVDVSSEYRTPNLPVSLAHAIPVNPSAVTLERHIDISG